MSTITYVPLSNELLTRLITRYGSDYSRLIDHCIEDFLDRTEDDWSDHEISADGYYWGQVFLPENTELRTKYHGEWLVSTVRNGKILYLGKSFESPGKACNAMRGNTSNNAWITLEIKRPQDIGFRLADKFRS